MPGLLERFGLRTPAVPPDDEDGWLSGVPTDEIPDAIAELFEAVRQQVREECAEIALRSCGTWKSPELQEVAERVAEKIAQAIRARNLPPVRRLQCKDDNTRLEFDGLSYRRNEQWSCPECDKTYEWIPRDRNGGN